MKGHRIAFLLDAKMLNSVFSMGYAEKVSTCVPHVGGSEHATRRFA